MDRSIKPFRIGPSARSRLAVGRLSPRRRTRVEPARSWARDADGIAAARRAAIDTVLRTPSTGRTGELDLAEAFDAIASPAVRRRILDLARQIADAD